jgi:hypothetical protein
MELTEVGWGDMNWIHLAQDEYQWQAHVNTVMNIWVPWGYWKILEFMRDCQLLKIDSASWS